MVENVIRYFREDIERAEIILGLAWKGFILLAAIKYLFS